MTRSIRDDRGGGVFREQSGTYLPTKAAFYGEMNYSRRYDLAFLFIQIITLRYNLLKLGAVVDILSAFSSPPPFRTINTSLKLILLGRVAGNPLRKPTDSPAILNK